MSEFCNANGKECRDLKTQLTLFQSRDGMVSLPVPTDGDTVWLSQAQMAELFGKDRTVVARHIKNAINEGEIDPNVVCANFAHTTRHGALEGKEQQHEIVCYNLDVIISVGYRVHSQRGVEFRRWATGVLKDYLIRGAAINRKRLQQLGQAIEVMKRVSNSLDAEQILDVVKTYSAALDLLDDYDHQRIGKPQLKSRSVELTYADCRSFIDDMKFSAQSDLFGNEKDGSFKSALGAVYQSFDGKDLYPSAQEKAANLLYLVTKNHGFSDGNKRIAAGLFLYFLSRNKLMFRKDGSKRIADHTLVALTVMIAESRPEEKEMMVNLVMTFLK
ncbi:MAG: virulence RhuM family protein [Kiritimatiellae bacterium]|nr:virulence RhuM family protein [Kiritimatiellia bacterium]